MKNQTILLIVAAIALLYFFRKRNTTYARSYQVDELGQPKVTIPYIFLT